MEWLSTAKLKLLEIYEYLFFPFQLTINNVQRDLMRGAIGGMNVMPCRAHPCTKGHPSTDKHQGETSICKLKSKINLIFFFERSNHERRTDPIAPLRRSRHLPSRHGRFQLPVSTRLGGNQLREDGRPRQCPERGHPQLLRGQLPPPQEPRDRAKVSMLVLDGKFISSTKTRSWYKLMCIFC